MILPRMAMSPVETPSRQASVSAAALGAQDQTLLDLHLFPCLLGEEELGLKIEEQVQIAWNGTNTTQS